MDDEKTTLHPSFGTVVLKRMTGSRGTPLFGSSVLHSETIGIEISPAYLKRYLNTDWIGPDKMPIIEIEMSPVQFAEMVATHGKGGGTPCTIRYVQGERMPEPPYVHPTAQAHEEFRARVADVAAKLDGLMQFAESLKVKASVSKGERDDLIGRIRMARQSIASDMPFATKCFQETIERATAEARGEIDAHLLRLIHETGIAALRAGSVSLPIDGPRGDEPEAAP